jgi:hypothetical protein
MDAATLESYLDAPPASGWVKSRPCLVVPLVGPQPLEVHVAVDQLAIAPAVAAALNLTRLPMSLRPEIERALFNYWLEIAEITGPDYDSLQDFIDDEGAGL